MEERKTRNYYVIPDGSTGVYTGNDEASRGYVNLWESYDFNLERIYEEKLSWSLQCITWSQI